MSDQGGWERGELPETKGFYLSDYRKGWYQPDGHLGDAVLSEEAVANWERDNGVVCEGKAWGKGQALYFDGSGKVLVCGRNRDEVDVVVDCDPDEESGFLIRELGVSRRHFELHPPTPDDAKVMIRDLNSKNGLKVSSKEREVMELHGNTEPFALEVGDFVLFGGGEEPEKGGRLIGFRVCKSDKGEIFLVKFNATDLDDLLALVGMVNPEQLGSSLEAVYRSLVEKVRVWRQTKPGTREYLGAMSELFQEMFEEVGNIAEMANWEVDVAASQISGYARDKAANLREKIEAGTGEEVEVAKEEQTRALEIALLTIRLANGELVEKVK